MLRHAVLLLDENLRLLLANSAAEALLSAADGLSTKDGLLRATTPAVTVRLHTILATAAGKCGTPARAG